MSFLVVVALVRGVIGFVIVEIEVDGAFVVLATSSCFTAIFG